MNLLKGQAPNGDEKLTGKRNTQWIIDTGTSHHMTGNLSYLTKLREVSLCLVGLPNGEHATAIKEGNSNYYL